ncbi:DNA/RNA non-specific endonuclease [Hymenobacter arizonensis]|uniref:Endonuclease G n=1 Tax=Hymenobacter arizonensis TaxID=1227077 RepID=A0A1I6AFL8_HYMAR|nr:DNA/RNA non-specific endonuclease [Hymenobacter arizonensis]SFQ67524.1 endonuclease G [Hymenobacter arizonensis]
MKLAITRISSLVLLVALATACSKQELTPAAAPIPSVAIQDATRDSHLAMGNPSGATTNTAYPSNYLMSKSQYALSYNRDKGKANWVSWHLSSAWVGSTARQDNFAADATLPSGWYRVTSSSYTGSGFDRGHECPSADRTGSVADNSATFLMTNMMPQAPQNNQRTWAGLENYCRTLINQGNELYIICGSYGTGGTGSAGYKTTIDAGRVTVPNRCWKVVVVLPEGSSDASRVTTSTRIIAINTPNDNALNTDWGTYRTSVNAIESATGYNILSAVSTAVQDVIEARVDNGPTS